MFEHELHFLKLAASFLFSYHTPLKRSSGNRRERRHHLLTNGEKLDLNSGTSGYKIQDGNSHRELRMEGQASGMRVAKLRKWMDYYYPGLSESYDKYRNDRLCCLCVFLVCFDLFLLGVGIW